MTKRKEILDGDFDEQIFVERNALREHSDVRHASACRGLGIIKVRRYKRYHFLNVVNLDDKLKHIGHC